MIWANMVCGKQMVEETRLVHLKRCANVWVRKSPPPLVLGEKRLVLVRWSITSMIDTINIRSSRPNGKMRENICGRLGIRTISEARTARKNPWQGKSRKYLLRTRCVSQSPTHSLSHEVTPCLIKKMRGNCFLGVRKSVQQGPTRATSTSCYRRPHEIHMRTGKHKPHLIGLLRAENCCKKSTWPWKKGWRNALVC